MYTHFREIGWNNAHMIAIRDIEFETRTELLTIEREEIDKYLGISLCLNHNRPVITTDEKREMDREYGKIRRSENKEAERSRVAEWRKNNPEKYAEQKKRSIEQQTLKRRAVKNNLEVKTN